ncbi:MAG: 30S ribosomal protein S13 [Candidatus Pacebacteria bacterium]|mgnify:FL=1|nr:30S ribosomal protein S13 [Candidatus Paceibacterota bacterium]MBP9058132.1 30S ribosomal protein S13 [Candidatus Paceibacterota bacterium]MBP9770114.1 30S ribosomal protein S13 [Candidatus Paceibacterota bacterium]
MRILGITIPNEKRVDIGLTVLFGIGRPMSVKILNDAKVDVSKKVSELSDKEENDIRKIVEAMNIEGNLKREISANIKRLKDIKAYRGVRHLRKMPVRGQRTKTNSRTVRGNVRKTMTSGRRKTEKT